MAPEQAVVYNEIIREIAKAHAETSRLNSKVRLLRRKLGELDGKHYL